ncbi:MAG: sensor histidine kinase, partial [Acidobacteriota bacterium]
MSFTTLDRVPPLAGTFAIAVGTSVLAGWVLDNDLLKGAGHAITMKPNAAIGLAACGLALLIGGIDASGARRRFACGAAILVGVIGLLTLSEHVVGWDLGIDQLLFAEVAGAPATVAPGRMGPNASTSLLLAGLALASAQAESARVARWSQRFALVVASLATIAVVGYVYGARELYSVSRYTGIAWPTAVTLLVIAIGILFVRPELAPMSTILSRGPGGIVARRMLLPAVVVPLALGYAGVIGLEGGFYDAGLGTALLSVSVVAVLAAVIWRTASRVDEADLARERARKERDELLERERAAREQAEHANRLKDEFLAALSHELRTPLNAVLGWAEMMRSDIIRPEQRSHAIEVVARNGRILSRLIEDLLDVSRIEMGQLELRLGLVDVAPLARTALDAVAADADGKGVRLISRLESGRAIVMADSDRLQQIVRNLLTNAVKFTPSGGEVELLVEVRAEHVHLIVRDTGRGIDPAFVPHVFERFRQEDGTPTREHGGLGLGLSI